MTQFIQPVRRVASFSNTVAKTETAIPVARPRLRPDQQNQDCAAIQPADPRAISNDVSDLCERNRCDEINRLAIGNAYPTTNTL